MSLPKGTEHVGDVVARVLARVTPVGDPVPIVFTRCSVCGAEEHVNAAGRLVFEHDRAKHIPQRKPRATRRGFADRRAQKGQASRTARSHSSWMDDR